MSILDSPSLSQTRRALFCFCSRLDKEGESKVYPKRITSYREITYTCKYFVESANSEVEEILSR